MTASRFASRTVPAPQLSLPVFSLASNNTLQASLAFRRNSNIPLGKKEAKTSRLLFCANLQGHSMRFSPFTLRSSIPDRVSFLLCALPALQAHASFHLPSAIRRPFFLFRPSLHSVHTTHRIKSGFHAQLVLPTPDLADSLLPCSSVKLPPSNIFPFRRRCHFLFLSSLWECI